MVWAMSSHVTDPRADCHAVRAEAVVELDLTGLKCPLPALRTRKALRALPDDAALLVTATDRLAAIDIPNVVREEAARIESQSWSGTEFRCVIRRM